jgi:hypothetical protein
MSGDHLPVASLSQQCAQSSRERGPPPPTEANGLHRAFSGCELARKEEHLRQFGAAETAHRATLIKNARCDPC